MEAPDTLVQRRLVDGLEYHFVRDGEHDGRPSYTRTDGMVLCRWHDGSGWVACSPDGIENGWPVFPADTLLPVEWPWWSHKWAKSCTYVLTLSPEDRSDLADERARMVVEAGRGYSRDDMDPRMPEWIRERCIAELGL